VKIRWTPAAAASARHFMHDQDGMRAIGAAVAGLAEDPLPAEGFRRPMDDTAARLYCTSLRQGF